jgi:RNA polymerase sigma factor (sigma-70 family)
MTMSKNNNYKFRTDYAAMYPGVEISDELMAFLKKSDRKMEYMERDIKRDRVLKGADRKAVRDSNGRTIALPELETSLDQLISEDWEFPDSAPSPEELCIQKETYAELHRCIDLLNDDERVLIQALFFDELTEREAAQLLGISQPAVHRRKEKILNQLKQFIKL